MKLIILLLLIALVIQASPAYAADQNYITPVFPIRGREYWRQGSDINHFYNLKALIPTDLPHTWLVHYDILADTEIITTLKNDASSEIGLFLEITKNLAHDSYVKFDWENGSWSQANKIFLSGYDLNSRRRMIDQAFSKFKAVFGYYPKSYGAWYIDVWSLEYIRDHYQSDISLGLADQYSTDGYQTWGQYLNLPYYVSVESAIEPASSQANSTQVLKVQWAPRHPLLFWGNSVEFSNYSAQVNDYHRGKGLDTNYFETLLKDLTINVQGQISQAVIGIEVGELETKYHSELANQFGVLKKLSSSQQLTNLTLSQFNDIYRKSFQYVSPVATVSSQIDTKKITWTMTPQFREGVLEENGHQTLIDLRYYHASDYRDNDQILSDTNENLVRLVPKITGFPLPTSIPVASNDTVYGHYSGRFPKLKTLITNALKLMPDLIYSKIENDRILGFRLGFENLIGLRFPNLKIGKFHFDFPILENFISMKKKLTPNFTWTGKQEIELQPYKDIGLIFKKGEKYGQDELISLPENILFENSYYAVYKKP